MLFNEALRDARRELDAALRHAATPADVIRGVGLYGC
eukprot:gene8266-2508_t